MLRGIKKVILFIFIAVFSGSLFFYYSQKEKGMIKEVLIRDSSWKVEAVREREERKKGLSGRESICDDCGMLFLFERPERNGFWMKEMLFDLDIIWIDGNKVSGIEKNVPRDSREILGTGFVSDKVLEILAGSCDRFGIKEGDEVYFR